MSSLKAPRALARLFAPTASGVAAALVISLAVVGPAMAGTLQLTFDAYDNAPPGCEIWSTNGDSAFGMDPPCSEAALGFYGGGGGSLPAGARVGIQTTAPPGIAINSAFVSPYDIYNLNNGQGWGGGSYYAGGGSGWTNGAAYEQDSGFSSSYWGFQMICGFSVCTNYGGIYLNSIVLTATEDQAPGLIALGNNLWYQGAHDVWNPPGDPWSIALESSDPSGVCSMSAVVNGVTIPGPSASPNTSVWQQCPDQTWTTGATVDTRDFVGTSGPLSLTLSATNAAGVTSSPSETLDVDNDPVTVSLATLNDPNPSVWVNHAVTLDATAHAGPSGVGSLACSVDGAAAQAYPSGGVTINGTGVHTASCTATNQAVDPQGVPNSGSGSMSIKIDETPPNVLIEPSDPSNPTELVADTSDGQSGVAGGSFAMRPVGSNVWEPLSTQFNGGELIGSFDDSGLAGPYQFEATSCDNVGNCASRTEQLTLPVRLQASSAVSFQTIVDPLKARKVTKRIRVGYHFKRVRRHGKTVRVKVGGHIKTVTVIKYVERCTRKRVKTGKHHRAIRKTCKKPHVRLLKTKTVAYGKSFTVHGLLTSAQGVPLAHVPVQVLTAPANGSNNFTPATTAQTDSGGNWVATLPPGPSRIIRAVYGGSATVLPAAGVATARVRARVRISISPKIVPWGSIIRITGRVRGGYVPTDSKLLQLNVGIGRIGHIEGLPDIRSNGSFVILWKFDAGQGVVHPWFSVGTLPEAAFPYSSASSNRVTVTLGEPTPQHSHHRHRRKHKTSTRHGSKHKKKGKRR